jgi:alkanesulfonate monooxygenase SsuD/methylene tetrahydromethanopterin reductase-like flavin-dependent oxidoreductase (luciferase family)
MKFAHFAHVWGKAGMTPEERYDQLWRELETADAVGFDYGFCVEHHFTPDESWMSAPNIYVTAVAARTKTIRMGGMGHVVPLHHPLRLIEEIALTDQVVHGRLEVGLVPGILPSYFGPFGIDFETRREKTLEFVGLMRAAYTDEPSFSFDGTFNHFKDVKMSINPKQRPHPPLWLETRDPATLEFCAREGINTGYFVLFPRDTAASRYGKYLADWKEAGWDRKPNIAYSTVVYVDETDEKAIDKALDFAGKAYRGFFRGAKNDAELDGMQSALADLHQKRGDPGAAEIIRHLLDKDYLLENDLILIGSPDTVAKKLRQYATEGLFNVFMGEFNFGELAEEDLLRSIRLFGEEVIPKLRDYEPF